MVDSNDNSSESGEDMLPSQNPESISRKRTHAGYRRSQGHPEENTAYVSFSKLHANYYMSFFLM